VKWGEDRLNAVKGREQVEWDVKCVKLSTVSYGLLTV
jgi:hypothetical protein